ncbi:MAG: hypothetical protein EZS28_016337, partial [Streblomastix strix]
MSGSHDNGKIHPKTKVLFGKLKQIAKMFDGIVDFDDLAMKMRKRKRNEEDASNENEKSETSVATPSPPPRKLHKDKKHKNITKKSKRQHQHKRLPSMSVNSLSDSQSTASEIGSSDDNLVYRKLQKIIGESRQSFKPLDFKFPPSTIEKDVHAVAPDKVNFPTAVPPQRWEGHDDEDGVEAVILSAVTTRSVLLVVEEAAKVPRSWKKLREPITRTFRLSHQTTVHAQAAREALVLNERGKFLKATTPPPRVIRQSVMKELNKRSSSAQTLFTGGWGEAGPLSRVTEREEGVVTRQTPEQLNSRNFRGNKRSTNEISSSMDRNRGREAGFDGNNACLEGRKKQAETLATIKTDIAPRKHSSIHETPPRGDQSESYNLSQSTSHKTLLSNILHSKTRRILQENPRCKKLKHRNQTHTFQNDILLRRLIRNSIKRFLDISRHQIRIQSHHSSPFSSTLSR